MEQTELYVLGWQETEEEEDDWCWMVQGLFKTSEDARSFLELKQLQGEIWNLTFTNYWRDSDRFLHPFATAETKESPRWRSEWFLGRVKVFEGIGNGSEA